jgi:hypothetical protein
VSSELLQDRVRSLLVMVEQSLKAGQETTNLY